MSADLGRVGGMSVGSIGRVLDGTVKFYIGAAAPDELVCCLWSTADCPVRLRLQVFGSCGLICSSRTSGGMSRRRPRKVVVLVDASGTTEQLNVEAVASSVRQLQGCLTFCRMGDEVILDVSHRCVGLACAATTMVVSKPWLR
jgi:hypothetical protein